MDALIKMIRDEPAHEGGPVEADVHPDEIPNFQAGGWVVAPDAETESETGETPPTEGGQAPKAQKPKTGKPK